MSAISWEREQDSARPAAWKIGELARRTGLSVRTLHYYDEIGLLSPSHHTEAGHRLYTDDDIVRLQQIRSLQQLGFSLEEVRACLDRPDFSPQRVIELHITALSEQFELQRRLCERLQAIASGLRSTGEVSVEEFIKTIEEINRMEKHYTEEQLDYLKERARTVGEERIREAEAEWPQLIEQVRAELDKGTDPASERVQLLARRWMALVNEFTGGNPEIEKVLRARYQEDPTVGRPDGNTRMLEYIEYISKALAASS